MASNTPEKPTGPVADTIRFIAGIALSAFIAAAAAQDEEDNGGKLYKWVDEDGNVTYQDTPPPGSGGQVETIAAPAADEETAGSRAMPAVDLTFYAIETCEACDLVRQLLRERGIPFEEKNAEGSKEVQDELREVAGALSVPVLQIGDQVLKGYNRALLLNELEEAGFPTTPARTGNQGETETAGAGAGEATDQAAEGAPDEAATSDEDDFATTFDEDEIFADDEVGGSGDPTEWEEIPEDERIQISQ